MLEDFEKDRPLGSAAGPPLSPGEQALGGAAVATAAVSPATASFPDGEGGSGNSSSMISGMQAVMRSYESELRSPLRNLLMGDLARAMLIQVCHIVNLTLPCNCTASQICGLLIVCT